jgi:hypothetical protein
MGWDTDGLDRWINGLTRLERDLAGGRGPLAHHQERYVAMAGRVARQTLLAMRPQDVAAEEWMEQVGDFVELIYSRLASKGIDIVYEGRTEENGSARRHIPITYEDILQWVRTPVEEGGKDRTSVEINRNRRDEQIAYDVHQAIQQNRLGFETKDYSRITARLEAFVDSRVLNGDMQEMLSAVFTAWINVLEPAMLQDLSDMVDDALASW